MNSQEYYDIEDASLKENIQRYIGLQKDLFFMKSADKVSGLLAQTAVTMAYVLFAVMAVVFLSVALANVLNAWWQSNTLGYVAVAILYTIVSIVLYSKGKTIFRDFIAFEILNILFDEEEKQAHQS